MLRRPLWRHVWRAVAPLRLQSGVPVVEPTVSLASVHSGLDATAANVLLEACLRVTPPLLAVAGLCHPCAGAST